MSTTFLTLPDYGDAGPEHWQSRWEGSDPAFVRVRQADFHQPRFDDWYQALERAVAEYGEDVMLVAHGLGCLLAAKWLARSRRNVRGALLVALPDPQAPDFPTAAQGFDDLPSGPLAVRTLIIASTDDPLGNLEHSRRCAQQWGSRWLEVGACGHIDAASGLGDWPQGRAELFSLV